MSIKTQSEAANFVRKYVAAKHEFERLDALKAELVPYVQDNGALNKTGKSIELYAAEHKVSITPLQARPSYAKAIAAIKGKYPELAADIDAIIAEYTSLEKEGFSVSIR